MTAIQQKTFTLLNTAWSILEPHIKTTEDKEQYKKIMGECFRMYFKKRQNEFSDPWWEEVTTEFLEYPHRYEDTPFYDFAAELSFGFLNYWEHSSKLTCGYAVFYRDIQKAFTEEWIRIEQR